MKKKRILLGIALASASIFALASCGSSNNNNDQEPQDQETGGDEQSTKATVTFNTNGGGTITSQTIDKGDKATAPANPTKDGFVFLGWYTTQDFTGDPFDFNTAINANITLYAKWKVYDPLEDYVKISTKQDFLDFIECKGDYIGDNDTCDKNVILLADIDLTGEVLELSNMTFTGTFDGQGHVIKNAVVNGDKEEQKGLLFKSVEGDAVIKDVKFLGVSVSGEGRWLSIVTGLCNGNVTFDGVEFNACNIVNTNTNAAFLFARNTQVKTINIKNITVKNNSFVHTQEYGGLVAGDIVGGSATAPGSTVNFENLDVDGELWSKGTGALVTGRCRDFSTISIKNAVVTGKLMSADGSKDNKTAGGSCAAVAGGNKQLTKLTMENVYSNVVGAKNVMNCKSPTTPTTITNCYSAQELVDKDGSDPAEFYFVAKTDAITPTWLSSTLKLDFTNAWKTEGENDAKYRLIKSSTNVRSAGATLTSVQAVTGAAKVRYHQGEDFSTQGLLVMGAFSDGVQLVLQSDEFEVISTSFDKNTTAQYEITVKSTEDETKTATYNVKVVHQTGFEMNTVEVQKLYVKGTDFNKEGLGVYSVWSDGIKELEAAPTIDTSAYQKNTAGKYEISVSHGGFTAQTISVSVVDDTAPVVVDDHFYVNVNASATVNYSGEKVNGVETFTSVGDAVAYLTAYKTELADATKVIRVAPGTYREKIDINLDDVVLIGTGTNPTDTKIVYDAVESTYSVKAKKTYGLNGATLNVNGKNFKADNIAIWNNFDYINKAALEASPQGLALTINGDKAVLNNVDLYGNQDTLYAKAGRIYFNNSKIAGNVDFIFGENTGLMFFNQCTIEAVYRGSDTNNGYVTAMRAGRDGSSNPIDAPTYGYIFYQCNFTADSQVKDGSMGLARPWGDKASVAFIECTMSAAYAKEGFGNTDGKKPRWDSMNGYPQDAFFVEYGNTGDGAITTAVTGGRILTATEAANYTVANLFAPTNGGVTWKIGDADDPFDYQAALAALAVEKTIVPATSIKVSSTQDTDTTDAVVVSVERNKTFDISYYVSPWNANDKSVTFEYDDTKLEFDEAAGTVKGKAEGAATFVIKQGTVSFTVNVTVTAPTGTNTVTFMDGSTVLDTKSGAAGDTLDVSSIDTAKSGFQFVRWYEDAQFTKVYTGTTIPDTDKTVYARYIDLNVANVVYIDTAAELVEAMGNVASSQKTYYITADIDMTGVTYNGIKANNNSSFYGYGYSIKNWSATYAENQTGFFGIIKENTIKDIVFEDCTVSDGGTALQYIGFFAGQMKDNSTVSGITFKNCVMNTAASNTLGFVAEGGVTTGDDPVTITNISIIGGSISGTQYVGCLFGRNNAENIVASKITVKDVEVNPTKIQIKNSGGLLGKCDAKFTLTDSNISLTYYGDKAGDQYNGCLIGYTETAGDITISNTTINVTGDNIFKNFGYVIGRLKDSSKFSISECNITATISATTSNSARIGMIGQCGNATLSVVEVDMNVNITTGSNNVGSIVGACDGNLVLCTLTNNTVTGTIVAGSGSGVNVFFGGTVPTNITVDFSTCKYTSTFGLYNGSTQITANLQGSLAE